MKKTFDKVEGAPSAVGPYSVAVSTGDMLYTSGQLPMDPVTGEIIGDTPADQARYSLENLKNVIENLGSKMENVVKVTIFITDMDSFAEINNVYSEFFLENCPARSCVEVSRLPKDALIEIEAIALM